MGSARGKIVETFLTMLEETSGGKITVKSLVARCGINRNTFYYYFHDIPDLVEGTMKEWINQLIQTNFHPDSPMACLAPLVEYGMAHKAALLRLYSIADKEAFISGMNRLNSYFVTRYMDSAALSVAPEDRVILDRFFKCLLTGAVLDWLDARMSYDLLGAAQRLGELLSGGPAPQADA